YYSEQPTKLLHNFSYLHDDEIQAPEIYVIARRLSEPQLREYGTPTLVCESPHSRSEKTPDERWALFQLRFRDSLTRVHGGAAISPMQAAGRAPGPFLE